MESLNPDFLDFITLLDQGCVEHLKWQLKRAACERTNCFPSPDRDESLEQPKDYPNISRSARMRPHGTLVLRRSPSGFDSGASHLSAPRFSSRELN